jgi:hypothetical protein
MEIGNEGNRASYGMTERATAAYQGRNRTAEHITAQYKQDTELGKVAAAYTD